MEWIGKIKPKLFWVQYNLKKEHLLKYNIIRWSLKPHIKQWLYKTIGPKNYYIYDYSPNAPFRRCPEYIKFRYKEHAIEFKVTFG